MCFDPSEPKKSIEKLFHLWSGWSSDFSSEIHLMKVGGTHLARPAPDHAIIGMSLYGNVGIPYRLISTS